MDAIVILAAAAGIPTLLAVFFRVNAAYFFISVAAGGLLASHLGDDAGLALSMVSRADSIVLFAGIGLQLLPVALTVFFLRGSAPKSKALLHILPLVGSGLILAVLLLPLLDSATQTVVSSTQYGTLLRSNQDMIIGAGALLVLFLVWTTGKPKEGKHKKKH